MMAERQRRQLIRAHEVANWICVTEHTLAKWRAAGVGPRFVRVERRIAYDPVDVESWLESKKST